MPKQIEGAQTNHQSADLDHGDDCPEDKRENYQYCSVLCCVQQLCTVICRHIRAVPKGEWNVKQCLCICRYFWTTCGPACAVCRWWRPRRCVTMSRCRTAKCDWKPWRSYISCSHHLLPHHLHHHPNLHCSTTLNGQLLPRLQWYCDQRVCNAGWPPTWKTWKSQGTWKWSRENSTSQGNVFLLVCCRAVVW